MSRPFEKPRFSGQEAAPKSGAVKCSGDGCQLVSVDGVFCSFHSSGIISDLSQAEISDRIVRYQRLISFLRSLAHLSIHQLEVMQKKGQFSQFNDEQDRFNMKTGENVYIYVHRVRDDLKEFILNKGPRSNVSPIHGLVSRFRT